MAKLHKVEMYVLDINDQYDENTNELIEMIDDKVSRLLLGVTGFNTNCVNINWTNDIDINYKDATVETYRKYFE